LVTLGSVSKAEGLIEKRPMNKNYLMRSGSLMGFEQAVSDLGGDAQALLRRVNLTLDDLSDGDKMIPVESMVRVLEYGAELLQCTDFGLRVAQYQDWTALGNVGVLLKNSDTLESVYAAIQRYFSLHTNGEYWDYRKEGNYSYITRYEKFHDVNHACQHQELSFGVCILLLQDLLGKNNIGARLEFSHKPMSDLSVYKKYFPMEVCFSQEYDRLILDNRHLTVKSGEINRRIRQQAEVHLMRLLQERPLDIEHQVRTILVQTMAAREHSIDKVAALLNTNRRALQRKLAAQGLDYKTLLSDVRMSTACWHLKSSELDITLLSEILGYSDVSAFSHAFKKSMNCSAREWRNREKMK